MFGKRLKKARENLGLSQYELADLAGVRVVTIWKYEQRQQDPKLSTAMRIAEALGVSLDWLATGKEAKK